MSTTPSLNSNSKVCLPSDQKRQKRTPIPRSPKRKHILKKRVFVTLIVFVLGYVYLTPSSALWALIQGKEAEGAKALTLTRYNTADNLPNWPTLTPAVRYITATPNVVRQPALQYFSTPMPLPRPNPTIVPQTNAPPKPGFSQIPFIPTGARVNELKFTRSGLSNSNKIADLAEIIVGISLEQKLDMRRQSNSTSPALPTIASLPTAAPTSTLTTTSQSKIEHVVIISIDGLRPDALDLANTPTLDDLRTKGAYSPRAQTVSLSRTLPGHASMLTGMAPHKHGILWGTPYIGWPGMIGPTLFNVAHNAGLSTAMVAGKEKFNYLILPNSVDKPFCEDIHDTEVKDKAIEFIEAGLPDILFIHFPDNDRVGHDYGWMSTNQLQAIAFTDGLIGEIAATLEREGYLNSTLIIVTADHGGHGFGHGDDSPLDRTIPWLIVGPGIPSGVTLSTDISTLDTAATVLHALDLPTPDIWDGQPVLEAFQ